jgi:hypothetical protein
LLFFASITAAYANTYVSLTLYEWMYNDDSAPRAYEAGEPVHYFAENDPGSRRYVQFEIVDSHGWNGQTIAHASLAIAKAKLDKYVGVPW